MMRWTRFWVMVMMVGMWLGVVGSSAYAMRIEVQNHTVHDIRLSEFYGNPFTILRWPPNVISAGGSVWVVLRPEKRPSEGHFTYHIDGKPDQKCRFNFSSGGMEYLKLHCSGMRGWVPYRRVGLYHIDYRSELR